MSSSSTTNVRAGAPSDPFFTRELLPFVGNWWDTALKIVGVAGLLSVGSTVFGVYGCMLSTTVFSATVLSTASLVIGLKGRAIIAAASSYFCYLRSCFDRIFIFWETLDVCDSQPIPVSEIFYDRNVQEQEHSIKPIPARSQRNVFGTRVRIENSDNLSVAKNLLAFYERHSKGIGAEGVAVLNLANRCQPGGNVRWGMSGREENLMRCTNYEPSLQTVQYPIPDDGVIYTPSVAILRDTEASGFKMLENPKRVNMIAVSAFQPAPLSEAAYVDGMKCRIRAILRTAYHKNNRDIVLNALGCETPLSDPYKVARLFQDVIEEGEFHGAFREIIFAISESEPFGARNCAAFKRVFP